MALTSTEQLALLYRLSQTFNSSLNLDEVLNDVMDEVIAAVHAERGFLMLRQPNGPLAFSVARGMDHRVIDSPQFQISRSVVDWVAVEGKPRLTSDAQRDAWLAGRVSVAGLGLRSILCVPLQLRSITQGVIYVDNRLQAGIFTEADLDLLSAIASTAAIAIENARLYQVAVEKGRMERELQVARDVQASLIPRETPRLQGWEFATLWQPAHLVGGDFYDFLPLSNGGYGIAVGDVSDKGTGAALLMAVTRSILRASVDITSNAADCIRHANRLLCADATRGMFVTLFYAELDPAHHELTYVNAGHNPPLHYAAATGEVKRLARTGLPLGIDDAAIYRQVTVEIAPGDLIVFYTDGIPEAMDAQERSWGMESLEALTSVQGHAPAEDFVTALADALRRFASEAPQSDDMTVVVARRTS
ncbi:MAG: GAF domain-containing SpoIIE family protein phosphatase [Anaerolineae bacterium]